jgi:uncharacterized protein YjbJ (UPF0337 family)
VVAGQDQDQAVARRRCGTHSVPRWGYLPLAGQSRAIKPYRGIVEDVKGKAKEIIGIVVNHEDLRKEGRAQQEKAQAQRDVAKKEAEATAARAAEKAAEAREKSAR